MRTVNHKREAWLRGACGDDDGLRAEVGRLLAQDERADRVGFLTPPEAVDQPPAGSVTYSVQWAANFGPVPLNCGSMGGRRLAGGGVCPWSGNPPMRPCGP